MQAPLLYNLAIYNGSYFRRKVVYKVNGNPVDLTGHTARAQIRTSYGAAVLLTITCTINTPTAGEIILEIPATATENIEVGSAVYDLELLPPEGEAKVSRLLMGNVTFSKNVTKVVV